MFGKVKLYAVVNIKQPNRFLTVVTQVKQAQEFASRFIYYQHLDHYKLWCECRNEPETLENWTEYYNNCISLDEKLEYHVVKVGYTRENIAVALRMLCGCPPLSCSFDVPQEVAYFKSQHPDTVKDPVDNKKEMEK